MSDTCKNIDDNPHSDCLMGFEFDGMDAKLSPVGTENHSVKLAIEFNYCPYCGVALTKDKT